MLERSMCYLLLAMPKLLYSSKLLHTKASKRSVWGKTFPPPVFFSHACAFYMSRIARFSLSHHLATDLHCQARPWPIFSHHAMPKRLHCCPSFASPCHALLPILYTTHHAPLFAPMCYRCWCLDWCSSYRAPRWSPIGYPSGVLWPLSGGPEAAPWVPHRPLDGGLGSPWVASVAPLGCLMGP